MTTAAATPREPMPKPELGIIISMFPELHETFILRELVALERRGMRFHIYSLQHPRDPITLDDAIRLSTERTSYSSLFTLATLGALARTLIKHPLPLLKSVASLVWSGKDRPMDIVKNLAILPASLHIAEQGHKRGIVHWHGHWANIPTTACWFLGRIFGDSWSAAIHGEDIFSSNKFLSHKLDEATFCVVCSDLFCQHLKHNINLTTPQNIHLNYHGLDPKVTERKSPDRQSHPELSVVSIGRLVPTKGLDVVINACAILRSRDIQINVKIIGSGPLLDELSQLVASLGMEEHVTFLGALAFEQVLETLEVADIFALAPRMIPGHPPDGIPNVIAEAMALGVPVVTTKVSAIPELVSDGETGTLVEVDDVEAFASALAAFHTNPQLGSTFSQAARTRVGQLFNQDDNIDDLLALFERYTQQDFLISTLPD